ncbi:MAG TPA: YbhN family protein [Actinomycetota bacterium]|nr:YbhN family protein [Actinomycetota bacterium]
MSRVSGEQGPAPPAARRRRWAGQVLHWAVGIGAAVAAFGVVFGRRDELTGALSTLEHLRWPWVVTALAAELGSITAYAGLQRRLLRTGGLAVGLGPLTALTLAANAIQNSLPVGPAWSTVYAFRQFRSWGADPVLAAWSLLISALVAFVALGVIALAGLAAAAGQATSLDLVRDIVGVVILILGLVLAVRRGLVGGPARGAAVWLVRASQRLFHRPHGDAEAVVYRAWDRLRAVSLSKVTLVSAAAWAMANWLLDLTCLFLAFVAVRSEVPWRGLLLAYGAGQLAANLPITPGGLGVVEGSLTVALVFYGGAEAQTVAAVLLYRVISFWLMLPAGWLAALGLWLASGARSGTTSGARQDVRA